MPAFKGPRKIRWYQAQATAAAIAGYLRYGRWSKHTWSEARAVRIARQISGDQVADGDLKGALQALDHYCQRELMAERMGAID